MIKQFFNNYIDLSDFDKLELNKPEDKITIYYLRAYNPKSYIKVVAMPVLQGMRNDLTIMNDILETFKKIFQK